MKSLKKIIYLLTRHEKVRAVWLLIMILSMALIDMMGIASIMPFIALLTNPEIIETNTILNFAYQKGKIFGIENEHQFLIAIGVFVFLLLIISITFKALTTYIQARFIKMCEYTIAKRLVERYLNQPYSWFLNRNSANLGKSILSEVGNVVGRGLEPMMSLVTNSLITFTLFFLLFVVEPKLSLIVIVIVCTFYGLIYKLNRNLMDKMGKENFKANESKFKVLNEAFGASKEVKVGGLEQIFINQFSKPAKIIAYNSAVVAILSQIPRYTLEAIAFGGMLLIILYFMTTAGDITNVLPIIALYAFAGYRLMPAIQKIYIALTYIRIVGPAVNSLYDDFKNLNRSVENKSKDTLKLNKDIRLNNIHYNYPNASKTALKNINLKIPAYSTIGLVGATGSGKTTTVDIILGLLQSQKGTLEVDGKIINNDNRRAWQHSIGYVPQQIFLVDNTVASNIAFGKDISEINQEAVEHAAKIANLHEFIVNELPLKYETFIGERGVRLSGGQRQRIGIARALYHKPQVLILDEATSALDNLTEKVVMEAVHNSENKITKILIAHRLSTVKKCDKIFLFDKGELKSEGTFEELIKINDDFRASAESN
jgi:ATP-binding cassette, subfamily B, bacterial PglK